MDLSALRQRLALRTRWSAARNIRPIPGVPNKTFEDMGLPVTEVPRLLAEATTDLDRFIYDNQGRLVHKWLHYPAVYDRYTSDLRGTTVRWLEIGVSEGGSLDLWRRYLGPDAIIHGIDIDPSCANKVTAPNVVHIGSQEDPAFLRGVVGTMGGLDVVLDDGSHIGSHQWTAFETLFPLLADGGIYILEDLHTSYWQMFGGGIGSKSSGIALIETLIQDMHAWHHQAEERTPARDWVQSIHVHESIVVIEKAKVSPPRHIIVPGSAANN